MTSIGPRIVAAAAALKPLGLYLLVSPPAKFVVTVSPDNPANPVLACDSIEQVEAFIADNRPAGAVRHMADVAAPIKPAIPRVGDKVHYVPHSTPRGELGPVCRAAFITELTEVEVNEQNPAGDGIFRQTVGLMVANPAGLDFPRGVLHDPGTFTGPEHEASYGEPMPVVTCDDLSFEAGTWHWAGHA